MNKNTHIDGLTVPILSVKALTTTLPYYSAISAGFPSPADDFAEEELNLDKYLVKNPSSTFFVRVEGDSMVNAGIYPNDILIVDRSQEAKSGDVIVAVLDGEFTVKRFIREKGKYYLKPENPRFKVTELNEESGFTCWGVVTNVIHKPYQL